MDFFVIIFPGLFCIVALVVFMLIRYWPWCFTACFHQNGFHSRHQCNFQLLLFWRFFYDSVAFSIASDAKLSFPSLSKFAVFYSNSYGDISFCFHSFFHFWIRGLVCCYELFEAFLQMKNLSDGYFEKLACF